MVKLFRTLDREDLEKQVVLYLPGVGTMHTPGSRTWLSKMFSKLWGLAFGVGVFQDIADAYKYLMNIYESDEDKIFIFDFSRGAYTARALAGLLESCGLLDKGNDSHVPYALRIYTRRNVKKPKWIKSSFLFIILKPILFLLRFNEPDWHQAAGFKKYFAGPCVPHFIGVWDTVKSIGLFRSSVMLPHTANHKKMKKSAPCYFYR